MACCCGSGGGSTTSLPIMTGPTDPTAPPDLTTHLPLYRNLTTGELWAYYGGTWAVTRAPEDWMKAALASTPLQSTDFITINRGGSPGSPFSGTYFVTTVQDLANTIGSIVGATTVSAADAAIDVTASGSNYAVGFNPQGGAAEIAGDATALSTLFAAATIDMLSDVSTSTPNVNDALVWNGSQWTPVPLSALTSDSFVNGGSVTGGGTTLTLTYNTASLPAVNINIANVVPNYDNTTSGLSATNMQAAIDELAAAVAGSMTNIGTGQAVYAGYNSTSGFHEFRTIDGANGVSVTIVGNTITVQFDPGSLTPVAIQQLASMIAGDSIAISTIAGAINLGDLADVDTTGATNGEVLKFNGTQWVPAPDNVGAGGGGAMYGNGVLRGICAECLDDALLQGLGAGDYFLHIGTTPPTLFQYDGANLIAVNPLPDVFICCNSQDIYVQCDGQMVGTWAVGDELAHMVMNVFCAVSEADAIALGLQAHQYWLDVSTTPPVLMHYNGTTSTPATFTPRVVHCCNSGDVYIRCQSGAGSDLVLGGTLGGGGGSAPTAVQAICATSEANAIADGLVAGGIWMDTSATPPVVYGYDGTTSTALSPQPDLVLCSNSGALYIDDGSGLALANTVAASNIQVTACPSGPVNADTDLQTAICQLSSASGGGGGLPFLGSPTAEIIFVRRNTIASNYNIIQQNNVTSITNTAEDNVRLNFATPVQGINMKNASPSNIYTTVIGHGVASIMISANSTGTSGRQDVPTMSSLSFVGPGVSSATQPALVPVNYVTLRANAEELDLGAVQNRYAHLMYVVAAIYDGIV